MRQVVREHVLLAAIDRDKGSQEVMRLFHLVSAAGFRNLNSKTSLTMIVCRYLIGHRGKARAISLLKALQVELKRTKILCQDNLKIIRGMVDG
jgi:hypothetical protein